MPDCKELIPFPLVPLGFDGRLGKSEMTEIGFRVFAIPSGHHRSIGSPVFSPMSLIKPAPGFNKAALPSQV